MQFPRIPYERFMAWAVGPISIIAGWASTKLAAWSLLGHLGISKDQTAQAIFKAAVFAVGAGATYLGHAKWFQNLPKWWDHNLPAAGLSAADLEQGPPASEPAVPEQLNPELWRANRAPAQPTPEPEQPPQPTPGPPPVA